MISIDIQNSLRSQLGFRHGFSRRFLAKKTRHYQPLVEEAFKRASQIGYGFLKLPDDTKLVTKIKKFAKSQQHKWENIVVLGIGGSALGLIAVQEALMGPFSHLQKKPHLFVIDNVDPDYMTQLADSIDVSKSLFIVISKSGGTVEPMTLYSFFRQKLIDKKAKKIQQHFVFITDAKTGLLRKLGKEEGIEMFEVPAKVGGRFSVLSSVGLVPAALAGVDISALLKGAKKMRTEIKKKKELDNPALTLATLQYLEDASKEKIMTVMMPYSNFLFRVGDWYRQLLAESIGKNKKTGPTPINALGTTDQHSQLQLYNEGPNNKWFIFLRVLQHQSKARLKNHLPDGIEFLNGKKVGDIIDAAYLGTSQSLAKNSRPNVTIEISKINAETMGALFMLFEFQVALLGFMYKVDAFNQPGVEDSKILTKKILSE